MKKLILLLFGCCTFLLLSCDGSFEKDLFAINLNYPDQNSKCEKGVPNGDLITIPFQWKPQGDIKNFQLILNDEPIETTPKPIEDGVLQFEFNVKYSSQYSWSIKSNEIESEIRTFNTPSAEENNNSAPYPVIFNDPKFSSTGMEVSWAGGDDDVNDIIKYDLYWHINEEISTDVHTDKQLNLQESFVVINIPNFNQNTTYYILVVSKDDKGNQSFSTKKICQFCDN